MFDATPARCSVCLHQSVGFARALESTGAKPLRLADGTLVIHRAFAPVTLRMIARPAAGTPGEMSTMLRLVPGRGPVLLAPDRPMALDTIGAVPLVSPQTIAVLDLSPLEDELFAALHQKWRNRLRAARKHALRVSRQELPEDANQFLLAGDRAKCKQRGYRGWPTALTLGYARENPGNAKLFTAFAGRVPVAAVLILRHEQSATYHIGYSTAAGHAMSAHNLLIWSAFLWAKSKGLAHLELGTIDTEDTPGLARFKLGTGARPRSLGGTWLWWPPLTSMMRPFARFDRTLMRLG